MHGYCVRASNAGRKGHAQMARIALGAKFTLVDRRKRQARDNGDAVIAFLAIDGDMRIAKAVKVGGRKLAVAAFGFLQAEHVGLRLLQKPPDGCDPQPDRIDVPRREGQFQG